MGIELNKFFEDYMSKTSLFKNKDVLQSKHIPDDILHRDEQINKTANILAPALREENPSNLFLYGQTGSGKTLSIKYIMEKMKNTADKKDIPLEMFYLNCKLKKCADTEYRLVAQLARFLGKSIPPTGLPTDEVYNTFFSALDEERKIVILILDEIDHLVRKAGDEAIYNLTRINSDLKNSQVSVVGITNSLSFSNNMDPRVKSSLSEEEVLFPAYDALQIRSILESRAENAFHDGVLKEEMIRKCSAYAAREHGDARRALELLRVAGELAERRGDEKIRIKHLNIAEDKIEKDKIQEIIKSQPSQSQLTLLAIMQLDQQSDEKKPICTGDIYSYYKELSKNTTLRPLTQRRISDIIGELDMLGIINAKVVSKGRFGRTREINLAMTQGIEDRVRTLLKEELEVSLA